MAEYREKDMTTRRQFLKGVLGTTIAAICTKLPVSVATGVTDRLGSIDYEGGLARYDSGVSYYVGPGGDDTNDGLTWKTRKSTLDAVEKVVGRGDNVYVSTGFYTSTMSIPLNRSD